MDKKFDKIIKTYKSILSSKEEDKSNMVFFALKSSENIDIKKYGEKEQEIIKNLIFYYKKLSSITYNYLNDRILNYYMKKKQVHTEMKDMMMRLIEKSAMKPFFLMLEMILNMI